MSGSQSLKSWPLVLDLLIVNKSRRDWWSPRKISYTLIYANIISPCILSYLMLGTLIAAKDSLYGLSWIPGINFLAWHKTFSISFPSSFLRSGYQIETEYSKCELTKELNKQRKMFFLGECKNVQLNPLFYLLSLLVWLCGLKSSVYDQL